MPLGPGARLGPYEVVALVGSGGMGEVYKAVDPRLNRTVAIKVLPAHLAADPSFQHRFEREAQVVAALNHPHICTLHDIGRHDQIDYLVMEYVDGETLADRLTKGALPLEQALEYAIQIAHALDKAHHAGIVHRDLKPGNVMVTKAGVKLLDFGLAKTGSPAGVGAQAGGLSMFPTTPPNLTVQGTILGTIQYMAPEQLDGQEADARTDLFAFGAVLYEMLTGRKAFEGKSQASLIAAIMHDEPAPISTLQPLAPTPLDRVVRKCLAKDPEARWQSARDLHDELQWIAEGATASEATRHSPGPRRREWIAWAVAAIGVLGAGVFAVPTLFSLRDTTPGLSQVRLEMTTPPTDDPVSFAISPDGRQFVFVANVDGGAPRLWLRPMDQTVAQQLVGTENASYPFWSPDSRAVGFFADGKLKRIDVMGGTPQVLADAPSARGGTWSRDGVILITPTSTGGLARVASTGGPLSPVLLHGVAGMPGFGVRWPQFLPDGRHFLLHVFLASPEMQGTYVASLDGGDSARVVAGDAAAVFAPPDRLLAVRQNALVAWQFDPVQGTVSGDPIRVADAGTDEGVGRSMFSVSSTGVLMYRGGSAAQRRRLAWFDRSGRVLSTVGQGDDITSPGNPELAPDGRRVALQSTVQGNVDIWFMDLSRGVESRFTFDPASEGYALWSPNGDRVVFASTRSGVYNLFEKTASGGVNEEKVLLATPQDKRPLSWSSDGRFVLYATYDPGTGADLWALPMTGDRKPFAVAQTKFAETEGQFSPDGRWVAYASNESGRLEIYVRQFPVSGETVQVSTTGGSQVRWRQDGKELYYVAPDARLMAVAITTRADGRPLEAGQPAALFSTRLASGANITGWRAQYATTSDGRFLLNTRVDNVAQRPISVVLNWASGFKK